MNRDEFPVDRYVDRLLRKHGAGTTFSPLRHVGQPLTMEQAYADQDAFAAALARGRDTTIGRFKIGLTSAIMQAMCGIDRPIYGSILSNTLHTSRASLDLSKYSRIGLEFEVSVRLGAGLAAGDDLSRDAVAAHVEAVCPAIEPVVDRNADYSMLDAASLTADNSWNAGVVLGDWQALPGDLATRRGRVLRDGEVIAEGSVGDVLGHPLEVVIWMVRELALTGRHLPADSVVMTGSIAKTQHVRPGQS